MEGQVSMDNLLPLLIGFAVGAALAYLWQQTRMAHLAEQVKMGKAQTEELAAARTENDRLKQDLAASQTRLEALSEKIEWQAKQEATLRNAFGSLAAESLKVNSEEFLKRAQERLNTVTEALKGDWNSQKHEMKNLVTPLQENLKSLDAQIRTLEEKREGAYQGIREQIEMVVKANSDLQTTTATLSQALKSSTVRGKWGEIQLKRIVEYAGMVGHVDFLEQASGEDGSRPDMVILLPNKGSLPVDAKTPMTSYLEGLEATDEATRKRLMSDHAKAIRSRVKDLSNKRYWDQFTNSPEFVVMFVPNDACLAAAFEFEPNLLTEAMEQKVLPVTPVTLLALLKTVGYGWQQQTLAENARQIAEKGRLLYERISNFSGHLLGMGKAVGQSVNQYNRAVASLESRVLPVARQFRQMGIPGDDIPVMEGLEAAPRELTAAEALTSLPEEGGAMDFDLNDKGA